MSTFTEKLDKLAEVAVKIGLNVQPGQEVLLSAGLEEAPLARLIVKHAYQAGAKNVTVSYQDDDITLTRYQYGSKEAIAYAPQWFIDGITKAVEDGACRLSVLGGNPSLLKDINPELVATSSRAQAAAAQRLMELMTGFQVSWSIVSYATPVWAKQIFPGESEEAAVEKLWDAIFKTSRIDQSDPVAAWEAHCNHLAERNDFLNQRRYAAIHFKGPGTDLKVGLADGHLWGGGWGYTKSGLRCLPNIPTEEVFTMPHRSNVEGYVSATKPLSLRGQLLENIQVRFEGGQVVEAKASKGQEVLEKLLETDEGARRLGEVALVPHSSPVSQCGFLFLNTLFDENAASHIALGQAYSENLKDHHSLSPEERSQRGFNDSLIHVDWMIGSDQVDVDGITSSGSSEPLMRKGEWV